jgi:FKBP-type peptidyl-prolyl cis-trans isomerase (trigger factor)
VRSIDANGAPIDKRGDEITELRKENFLIENIGSGSYYATLENSLIGKAVMVDNSAPNIQNTSSQRLILPNDFYVPEWRGKEVFVDMTFVSKECKLGEVVMVDYTGYLLDQETLERIPDDKGGYKTFDTGIGVQFFLGAHLAIEDFEAGIVGIKINESKSFNVTFPSDYFSTELKGQKAQFEVKVTKIYTPPVYNDEFVKERFGFDTTAEFENDLKTTHIKNQIQEYIEKNITIINYPKSAYDKEIAHLESIASSWESEYGITLDKYLQDYMGMTRDEYVKNNLKNKMMYYAVAQAEGITPTEAQLQAEKTDLIDYYYDYYISQKYSQGEAQKAANAFVEDLGDEYIYEQVIFKLVDESLVASAKVTYVDKTYTSVSEAKGE